MTLDQLYGAGAFQTLSDAIHSVRPDAVVTENDTAVGAYISVTWTTAIGPQICRMDCRGAVVNFGYLSTICNMDLTKREVGNATYAAFCDKVGTWLKNHGVKRVTAGTLDAASTQAMLTVAGSFVRNPDTGVLTWTL